LLAENDDALAQQPLEHLLSLSRQLGLGRTKECTAWNLGGQQGRTVTDLDGRRGRTVADLGGQGGRTTGGFGGQRGRTERSLGCPGGRMEWSLGCWGGRGGQGLFDGRLRGEGHATRESAVQRACPTTSCGILTTWGCQ